MNMGELSDKIDDLAEEGKWTERRYTPVLFDPRKCIEVEDLMYDEELEAFVLYPKATS